MEYLGQLNVKSDMLMEELKRVSKERDEINKKFEDAEKRAQSSLEEVDKMKAQVAAEKEAAKDDSTVHTESITASSSSKISKETGDTEDTEEFF